MCGTIVEWELNYYSSLTKIVCFFNCKKNKWWIFLKTKPSSHNQTLPSRKFSFISICKNTVINSIFLLEDLYSYENQLRSHTTKWSILPPRSPPTHKRTWPYIPKRQRNDRVSLQTLRCMAVIRALGREIAKRTVADLAAFIAARSRKASHVYV